MKLLILAPQPFFQHRGTPIAVKMLAEVLQENGHDVDLLVFHVGEDVDLGSVSLYRSFSIPGILNVRPGFSIKKIACDFSMLLKSVQLCRNKKYDAVHAVEESVFIAMVLKVIFRIPYIYDIDSWLSDQLIDKFPFLRIFRKIFSFFEKSAVRHCSGAVAVCLALEEKVRNIDTFKPILRLEDVSLLEDNCADFESLKDVVGNSGKIVLYVGNLEQYQGIDLLMQAFSLLSLEMTTPSLVIIGGSRKDKEKYLVRAEELAITSRVFFIGSRPISMLGMFLQQADMLVSPRTEGENTPMKIYSYMGSGVPLVATRIKSHTQVLNDTNALLADPEPQSMADMMMKGLRQPKLANIMAEKAQELVENEYSRSAFTKKLTGFYTELSNVWNLRI